MTSILSVPEQEMNDGISVILENIKTGEFLRTRALPVIIGRRAELSSPLDHEKEILYIKETTISRLHAELTANMGQVFLEDLSSTNGTFVNGERLPPNEKRQVVSGDTIRFAYSDYRLKILPCEQLDQSLEKKKPVFHVPEEPARTSSDAVAVVAVGRSTEPLKKQGRFSGLFRNKNHTIAPPAVMAFRHDPIEDDVRYKRIFQEVDAELSERFPDSKYLFGSCHGIWLQKKQILKERYGIDWKTPDEMNPDVIFD